MFVEALEIGQRGGSDPADVFATTLRKSSPELVERILAGSRSASRAAKSRPETRVQGVRGIDAEAASWDERVRIRAAEYVAYHESIAQLKRRLIRAEVARALEVGVANWTASEEVLANKSLLYETTRAVWGALTAPYVCESPVDGDAPPRSRYALRLSRIKCNDKDEVGHDEEYVVSIAVDGAGGLKAETSPRYSINDSDSSVKWPNRFLYAPSDPKGFLDLAVELWEDDGGYDEAAKAIAGIAAAVAAAGAAGSNPYVIAAGVALGLIAGLIGIAGWLDDDDRYGQDQLTWLSDTDLAASVGPHIVSFINRDTGWSDFSQWNYDLQIDLVTTPGQ